MIRQYCIIGIIVLGFAGLQAQVVPDSIFSMRIGSIGFQLDSLVFDIGPSEITSTRKFRVFMYNFGEQAVAFAAGKPAAYLELDYKPKVIPPSSRAYMEVSFYPALINKYGPFSSELALVSDDPKNPYKFLYFNTIIIEDTTDTFAFLKEDSVPRMYFNDYNQNIARRIARAQIYSYPFTNIGTEILRIDSIVPSAGIKIIHHPHRQILPGESDEIVVKVKSRTSSSIYHRTLTIFCNDPKLPMVVLGLHGQTLGRSPSEKDDDFCYD